ncbi:MAG TPA: glycosyltransferase [Albitalea sp.]|uniref:glycosyltransferase n=1 Tax=Piscinibacter sp. TaxID=1903157 RepID=UPI002ED00195
MSSAPPVGRSILAPSPSIREPLVHASTRPIKIGFVLLSSSRDPLPSTRIAVLNMMPFLRQAHFEPHIVYEPEAGTEQPDLSGLAGHLAEQGFRVVFLQKVRGPSVQALAHELRARGIVTVYGVCDLVDPAMVEATDVTVAVTDYLRSLYPARLQPKIHVVHDGIENAAVCKTDWGDHRGSRRRPLRAVLVTSASLTRLPVIGSPPDWLHVTVVGRYPAETDYLQRLREARWKLLQHSAGRRMELLSFLLNRRVRCVPWDAMGVYGHLRAADIGIIPVDTTEEATHDRPPPWRVKSENRLTLKMALGLPVIATPIPAYEPVIEQGRNGYLARSRDDWWAALEALRDPHLRRIVGERARHSVLERYSMGAQAALLIDILRRLLPGATA